MGFLIGLIVILVIAVIIMIFIIRSYDDNATTLNERIKFLDNQNQEKSQKIISLNQTIEQKNAEIFQIKQTVDKKYEEIKNRELQVEEKLKIIQETIQSRPELAKILARYDAKIDEYRAKQLEPRAPIAADTVRKIKEEKKIILEERYQLFHQLAFYEEKFPFLIQVKSYPICDAQKERKKISDAMPAIDALLSLLKEEKYRLEREKEKFEQERWELQQKEEHQFEREREQLKQEKERLKQEDKNQKHMFTKLRQSLLEQEQSHPGIAKILFHYSEKLDEIRLKTLSTRAYKAAEIVKDVKQEKKQIQLERDMYFAQLAVYEDFFPWLEDFKEVPIEEAKAYVSTFNSEPTEREYFQKWLSPEEYTSLSAQERLQISLDRWQKRKKSDWDVGIEYERYIGYLYEKKGYSVEYSGALRGFEDMGRDLIAKNGNEVLIVQCKRWSKQKQIHEKHIFQLFGTGILYSLENPNHQITLVFATTTELSETAKLCAEKLDIKICYQNHNEYPIIKCNVNRTTGEKIYHLPFDQQYDRVTIKPNTDETYVFTIEEAEALGFRHAFRHMTY